MKNKIIVGILVFIVLGGLSATGFSMLKISQNKDKQPNSILSTPTTNPVQSNVLGIAISTTPTPTSIKLESTTIAITNANSSPKPTVSITKSISQISSTVKLSKCNDSDIQQIEEGIPKIQASIDNNINSQNITYNNCASDAQNNYDGGKVRCDNLSSQLDQQYGSGANSTIDPMTRLKMIMKCYSDNESNYNTIKSICNKIISDPNNQYVKTINDQKQAIVSLKSQLAYCKS